MTETDHAKVIVAEANPHWTTERLLRCALSMLDECAKDQRRRKDQWLVNNHTLEVIRVRVGKE